MMRVEENGKIFLFAVAAFFNDMPDAHAQTPAVSAVKPLTAPALKPSPISYQSIVAAMKKQPMKPVGIANDLSSWNSVTLKVPLWHKIQGYLEVQPRFQMNHENHFSENILRTGIGYEFNKNWSVFNGYYWSSHYDPYYSPENRLWHQLTYSRKLGKISLQSRFRCEESWREGFVGPTVRIRNQIKFTRPIAHSNFYSIVSDEPMYNLNTKTTGPVAGFTQNRLFIGLGRKLNTYTKLEIGYLNQYRNSRSAKPDPMNHVLVAQLNFDFTVPKAPEKEGSYKLARKKETETAIEQERLVCTPRLFLPGNNAPAQILATEHHYYELRRVEPNEAKLAVRKAVLM